MSRGKAIVVTMFTLPVLVALELTPFALWLKP